MKWKGENSLPRNLPEDEKREEHPAHASYNLRPRCSSSSSSCGRVPVPVRRGGGREEGRFLSASASASASSTPTDWRAEARHVLEWPTSRRTVPFLLHARGVVACGNLKGERKVPYSMSTVL